jgi:hypothetical protein
MKYLYITAHCGMNIRRTMCSQTQIGARTDAKLVHQNYAGWETTPGGRQRRVGDNAGWETTPGGRQRRAGYHLLRRLLHLCTVDGGVERRQESCLGPWWTQSPTPAERSLSRRGVAGNPPSSGADVVNLPT